MLESSVVFVPLFLGSLKKALCPRDESPYKGASEVWVPISSTNTKLRLSSPPATERHATLSHSSLSLAPVDLFFGCEKGAS
jgi:hypothetical protein